MLFFLSFSFSTLFDIIVRNNRVLIRMISRALILSLDFNSSVLENEEELDCVDSFAR